MKRFGVILLITLVACASAFGRGQAGEGSDGERAELAALGYNPTGFPIVEERVEFSVFMGTHALLGNQDELMNESMWIKTYEEMTNVHLDLEVVLNLAGNPSPWGDQMLLSIASGEYQEMFWKARFTPLQTLQFGRDGVLQDLAPYIDGGYMPNLAALMEERPDIRQALSTPEGKIFSLGAISTNAVMSVGTNTIINHVWLDEVGMDEPTTVDELYDVMVAFKTQDPNGNGEADEWPAVFAGVGDVMSWMRHWGYLVRHQDNFMYLIPDTEEIVFIPTENDYKEFLIFMAQAWDEGLLHPDSFTMNNNQRRALGSAEVPVVGMAQTNSPGLVASGLSQRATSDDLSIIENRRDHDYRFFLPITSPTNGRRLTNSNFPYGTGNFAITNYAVYPEIAARWADYFFTDEGGTFIWAGVEGESWQLPGGQSGHAGGRIEWLLPDGSIAGADQANDVRKLWTMQPGGRHIGLEPMIRENIGYDLYPIKEPMAPWLNYAMPSFFFEDTSIRQVASIVADVRPYVEQFTAQAITGRIDIESEWETYLSTLDRMGLADLLKIYQDAYAAQYR